MIEINSDSTQARALLGTLSDDLALPLVQIKTTLELLGESRLNKVDKDLVYSLGLSAEAGLKLVEAYRLALSLGDNTQLPLEPVAIGAVLANVAHQLSPLAAAYQIDLWIDIQPKLTPVLAHEPSLLTALSCLGGSIIRAQASGGDGSRGRVVLGAHRHSDGTVTGVYSSARGVSQHALRAARNLAGKARQPLPDVPAGTASGVLVADMLCAKIWRPLSVGRYQSLDGLATLVPISQQLNLI